MTRVALRWLTGRLPRWVLISAITVVAFFVVGEGMLPWLSMRGERQRSIRLLEAARRAAAPEAFDEAVGLGAVVTLRDGSWVAIRYWDTHSGGIQSLATAVDSEGHWFESDRHYCGLFIAYASVKRQFAQLEAAARTSTGEEADVIETSRAGIEEQLRGLDGDLALLHHSAGLAEARRHLTALGFGSMAGPAEDGERSAGRRR